MLRITAATTKARGKRFLRGSEDIFCFISIIAIHFCRNFNEKDLFCLLLSKRKGGCVVSKDRTTYCILFPREIC